MSSKVTRGVFAVLSIGAFLFAGSPATAEEEQTSSKLKIRNYDHFEFDTVTGSYFGIATFYTEDDDVVFEPQATKTDNQVFTGEIRLVMGGESIQAGVMIPYHNTKSDALTSGQDDIGDIRAHFKFIPFRRELFDAGGGLAMTFPGGGEGVGITTGQVGTLPFLTGTLHLGPVDLNTHVGYQFYNDPRARGAAESVVYGSTLSYPVLEKLGLRLELAGQSYQHGEDRNVIALQPGLDYLFEIGSVEMQLSGAGSYGLSGGTAGFDKEYGSRWGVNTISGLGRGQWGIGGALAVLWN